ncbi:MAG TPA: S1C family serine protease [Vicinamibacteria bacterium]|nr:S1C family serine protease [Vicinamibacteria bacterium]
MNRDRSNQNAMMLLPMLTGGLLAGSLSLAQEAKAPAAIEELLPAVVRVTGYMRDGAGRGEYRRFAESTGFFVDESGLLLTIYDPFVAPKERKLCEKFEITRHDGQTVEARMFLVDPILNFAVLKMADENKYPAIERMVAPEIGPGDRVWAVAGSRSNEEGPIFTGVVKAENNSTIYAEGCGNELIDTFIEFPAIAYGGPLVSDKGNLIGINMPRKKECQDEGPGEEHATPIADINRILELLLAYPTFERKWLGFNVRHMGRDSVQIVRQVMNKRCGILVDFVWPEGPSGKADIRSGDILVMVNDEIVMTTMHLESILFRTEANTALELKLIRDGVLLTRRVRLEQRPPWAAL